MASGNKWQVENKWKQMETNGKWKQMAVETNGKWKQMASGNTPRMENGGKRKRVGLSLKSFKKPALNYVKKQPVGKCLAELVPTREGKLNLTSQEQIETPISENR